jgi:hypothetical protein
MAINNRFESQSSTEQRISKGGMTVSKMYRTDMYTSAPRGSLLRHAPSCLYNKVLPTSSKPTGMQSTETCTEKSTKQSTKSTKIQLKPPIESNYDVDRMVTEADFQRRLPSTNDYRLQGVLYKACGSTAHSSDSASALERGKYNNFTETCVLGVYE